MTLKPLADNLVIRPIDAPTESPGGIVLPDASQERQQRGLVMSVGPGRRDDDGCRISMSVEEGQTVLFSRYAGTEIELDGEKVLICREADVLAVIEE